MSIWRICVQKNNIQILFCLLQIPPFKEFSLINKRVYFDSKTKWEDIIKDLPMDTLSVFFIDGTIFQNEKWDTIRDNYLILKRCDFSLEDLQKSNFIITYP